MRTLFEDTEVSAQLEENRDKGSKHLLFVLWMIALAFLAGTWGVYRWASKRPAPLPPPPPVSLADLKQTSVALTTFNGFVRDEKWTEAEALLSTAARARLTAENKTLRDSLFGSIKNMKLVEAASTPSVDRSDPNKFRQDFVYVFADEGATKTEQKIIPLTLILENGKIVLDSWADEKPTGAQKKG